MLAIPSATGMAGFLPASLVTLVCWLFMLATGLILLEVCLTMPPGAHFLSMTKRYLGRPGEVIAGCLFVFLYYCLEISYVSGSAPFMADFASAVTGWQVLSRDGIWLFLGVFGGVVLVGANAIGRMNGLLVLGLVMSYLLLVGRAAGDVQVELLGRSSWGMSFLAAPTLFGAFGFHNVIPSLVKFMGRDVKQLRAAVILGTTLSLVVYLVWQWLVIGSLSVDQLAEVRSSGLPVTVYWKESGGGHYFSLLVSYFSFFALVTSFLGVSLSLVDFLADGLQGTRWGESRLMLCLMIFLPVLVFSWSQPQVFQRAFAVAGGIGEAVLNGMFPVAMAYVARYYFRAPQTYRFGVGKPVFAVLFVFALATLLLEVWELLV